MRSFAAALPSIAFFLFWPALALVVWGELTPHVPDVLHGASDKLLHFTAYFGLAALAAIALQKPRAVLAAVLGLAVLGGVLEIVQSYTGRDAEWLDEAANALGAGLGAIAGLALTWLVERVARD